MKKLLLITITPFVFALSNVVMAADYPEFGGRCAMGIVAGEEFKTDCSVDWTGSDGNQYCFGNKKAKDSFLKKPDENLHKAFENYEQVVSK
ncbi:MAG: hypothetical protein HUJ23_12015 [Methylophaga sp.]|nr:hypothetical protein [Methylophaga sp.]